MVLKFKIRETRLEKSRFSCTLYIYDIHYIASFLYSRYKSIKFLSSEEKEIKMEMIESSIIHFANTNPEEPHHKNSPQKAPNQSLMKNFK